ncbi:MAG TPA: MarR family transcriptional regulator [Candidatus Merdenecus merdavium]|nr:MarR family transcriptional regulator [Candidatus Merdenecus merdavium]
MKGVIKIYPQLKLNNQLCFPLYATSKEIIRRYKPYLDEIHLTYTQYITMMVIWEFKEINVKAIGTYLYLDSGTLTPLLKKLEQQKLIERRRSVDDERNVMIHLTEEGERLQEKAKEIPEKMGTCFHLEPDEIKELYRLLYKILKQEK